MRYDIIIVLVCAVAFYYICWADWTGEYKLSSFYILHPSIHSTVKRFDDILHGYGIEFRNEAEILVEEFIDYLKYEYRHNHSDWKDTLYRYQNSDRFLYKEILCRSYKKLLYSPFRLYSELSSTSFSHYSRIFHFAVKDLEQIGAVDANFIKIAEHQLSSTQEFCNNLQINGEYIDFFTLNYS